MWPPRCRSRRAALAATARRGGRRDAAGLGHSHRRREARLGTAAQRQRQVTERQAAEGHWLMDGLDTDRRDDYQQLDTAPVRIDNDKGYARRYRAACARRWGPGAKTKQKAAARNTVQALQRPPTNTADLSDSGLKTSQDKESSQPQDDNTARRQQHSTNQAVKRCQLRNHSASRTGTDDDTDNTGYTVSSAGPYRNKPAEGTATGCERPNKLKKRRELKRLREGDDGKKARTEDD